ncbi:MAG: cysteine--tRNA ligase, partial [Patescibacteria group bacterium]
SMPQAVALAWEVFKSELVDNDKRATLIEFDKVFGLNLTELKEEVDVAPEEIKELLKERDDARANKKWKKADELRDEIEAAGWLVEDETSGSMLKRIE